MLPQQLLPLLMSCPVRHIHIVCVRHRHIVPYERSVCRRSLMYTLLMQMPSWCTPTVISPLVTTLALFPPESLQDHILGECWWAGEWGAPGWVLTHIAAPLSSALPRGQQSPNLPWSQLLFFCSSLFFFPALLASPSWIAQNNAQSKMLVPRGPEEETARNIQQCFCGLLWCPEEPQHTVWEPLPWANGAAAKAPP